MHSYDVYFERTACILLDEDVDEIDPNDLSADSLFDAGLDMGDIYPVKVVHQDDCDGCDAKEDK